MHVLVEGNITNRLFLLLSMAGGFKFIDLYTDYITEHLENNYGVVYWDQKMPAPRREK